MLGFTLNGAPYFYLRNLQGDVVGIYDAAGNVVAQYEYDAWGNILEAEGTLAAVNPIRYRGYYYDDETKLYYLQSRYYNSDWGRFISADIYADTGVGILGTNMYAYCQGDPVNFVDPGGTDAYYFYLPEWQNEAKKDLKALMRFYNLPANKVHLIAISSADDLTTGWNSMEGVIDAVVINTHANPNNLSFGFGEKLINALENKDIGTLILYGCNAGHLDNQANAASIFARKLGNKTPVLASDGTVYSMIYGYHSMGDKSFKSYLNSKRSHHGWNIYYYDSDKRRLNIIQGIAKSMTLGKMLSEIKRIMKIAPSI